MRAGTDPFADVIAQPAVGRHNQRFLLKFTGSHILFCRKPVISVHKDTPLFRSIQTEDFVFHSIDGLNYISDVCRPFIDCGADLLRVSGVDMKLYFRMIQMKVPDFSSHKIERLNFSAGNINLSFQFILSCMICPGPVIQFQNVLGSFPEEYPFLCQDDFFI